MYQGFTGCPLEGQVRVNDTSSESNYIHYPVHGQGYFLSDANDIRNGVDSSVVRGAKKNEVLSEISEETITLIIKKLDDLEEDCSSWLGI